jgi:hypothetical protein
VASLQAVAAAFGEFGAHLARPFTSCGKRGHVGDEPGSPVDWGPWVGIDQGT